jgi:enoyl-CoA hydratase/carnithine racemase
MTVNAEVEGRVGWITLDRPPENRLDAGELEALDLAVGRVAEAEVAVAVIRSGSEEVFSAGADLREFVERSPDANLTACRRAHQVLGRFADEAPLFVAAIAGHALGLGYEVALACDIRVAAQGRYRIGLPEVTLGLLPATGGAQRLARLIGRGRALDLLVTGRTVASAEAGRLGMVDRLVPAGEFDQAVAALAADLAAGAPLAVAAITRVVNDGLERPLDDALDRDLDELTDLFASEDAREGMTASLERRAPKFNGRWATLPGPEGPGVPHGTMPRCRPALLPASGRAWIVSPELGEGGASVATVRPVELATDDATVARGPGPSGPSSTASSDDWMPSAC